ncbi:hypothetical protein DL765_000929 [Monosporascus sp. GIB2]|nr:hypothetical protein DL765_000929 [Monosporascus sp. GIB2]
MYTLKSTCLAVMATTLFPLLSQAHPSHPESFLAGRGPHQQLPRRSITGISVVDTPIVRAAQEFARDNSDDGLYGHVMRSWIFGAAMLSHNATLRNLVDEEVHAVAALLHDLGLDQRPNSPIVSTDKRFEVDGAIAARNFIRAHRDGRRWDEVRVQRVWDAIALHAELKIAPFKEIDVAAVSRSVRLDFSEPEEGITQEEHDRVLKEFPNVNPKERVKQGMSWLCRLKPDSTYDNWVQGYGERLVEGYSPKGHRIVDGVLGPE